MPLWWWVVWKLCTRVLCAVSTPRKRKHCTVKPSTLFSISDYYAELKTDAHCPQICPFKGLKKPKKILAQVHKCQLKPTKKSFGIQIRPLLSRSLFLCVTSGSRKRDCDNGDWHRLNLSCWRWTETCWSEREAGEASQSYKQEPI